MNAKMQLYANKQFIAQSHRAIYTKQSPPLSVINWCEKSLQTAVSTNVAEYTQTTSIIPAHDQRGLLLAKYYKM